MVPSLPANTLPTLDINTVSSSKKLTDNSVFRLCEVIRFSVNSSDGHVVKIPGDEQFAKALRTSSFELGLNNSPAQAIIALVIKLQSLHGYCMS